MKASQERLEWETQHIGQFEVEIKSLELELAKQFTTYSSRSPTDVSAAIIPTKAVPNIIPPKQPPPVRDKHSSVATRPQLLPTPYLMRKGTTVL